MMSARVTTNPEPIARWLPITSWCFPFLLFSCPTRHIMHLVGETLLISASADSFSFAQPSVAAPRIVRAMMEMKEKGSARWPEKLRVAEKYGRPRGAAHRSLPWMFLLIESSFLECSKKGSEYTANGLKVREHRTAVTSSTLVLLWLCGKKKSSWYRISEP